MKEIVSLPMKVGIWRLTYQIEGKKYGIERQHEHEARFDERDIQGYGFMTRVEFIDEQREPKDGPFEVE